MQAVIVTAGEPLEVGDVADPEPLANDVLIEVRAAGLNRADLMQRAGLYPPPPGASEIMGLEVAGVVKAVGEDVTAWSPGDRVCALLGGGGYATLATADSGSVFPIPESLSFEQAACLPEAMMTVWANVFMRGALTAGESLLVHGGTSGIGVMAIQMARAAGAGRIFATAGSDDKVDMCIELGADVGINYRTQDFVEVVQADDGADVILDMVGGDYIQRNIAAARLNGRIVNIAYQNGFKAEIDFGPVLMKRLTIAATTLRARTAGEKHAIRDAVREHFWDAVAGGAIRAIIDSSFPLADAEQAHQRLEAGGHIGKILLTNP